jgi:hypothetical protein
MAENSTILIIGNDPVDLAAIGRTLQTMSAQVAALKAGVQAFIAKTAVPAPAPAVPAPAPAAPAPAPAVPAPAPAAPAVAPAVSEITRFNQRLDEEISKLFKGVYGTEWAREKVIGILQTEFPRIDPNEIAKNVYTKAPDRWEYTAGLVKVPEKPPEELVLPLPTWKEIPPTEVKVPETKSWTEFFKVIPDTLEKIWNDIKDALNRIKELIKQLLDPEGTLYKIFDRLREFLRLCWENLLEFLKDPAGKIKEWLEGFVRNIKNWILEAADTIGKVGELIWNRIKGGFDNLKYWLYESVFSKLEAFWQRVKNSISNTIHEIVDPIGDFLKYIWDEAKKVFDWLGNSLDKALRWVGRQFEHLFWTFIVYVFPFWEGLSDALYKKIKESPELEEKEFYYGLQARVENYKRTRPVAKYMPGSMIETIRLMLSNPAEYQLRLAEELEKHHEDTWYKMPETAINIAGEWGKNWFNYLADKFYDYISGFKIPVPTEELDDRKIFKDLMADAAKGLGGLIAVSVAVSLLSKAQLGPFAAVLYDMSSFKYVTAGIMGALSTAAFVQPMRYFYNAKYRPYLPDFGHAFQAFSRNIISKKGFQFHLKYRGIPDDYLELYDRLASDPVSPFLIRGMAEAEITAPNLIFKYVMDRGYSLEKSIDVTGSLLWLASKDYRKTAERSVYKHLVEGYITLDEFNGQIQNIRGLKEYPVSYSTIDGETYSGKIYAPLSQEELMEISAEWDAKFDRLKEKESAIKTDLKTGDIDVETARKELSEFIKDLSKIEDIIRGCIRELKVKKEPEKGKDLRKELKGILTKCYKEGYITHQRLINELEALKSLTEESDITLLRAEWEAFYDDMFDQVSTLKVMAKDRTITIDDLQAELTNLGMRPSKIELIVKDIQQYLRVKNAALKSKIEGEIMRLRDKLTGLNAQLSSLDEQISAETDERRLRTLITKYNSVLTKGSKVEEDLAAKEEELKSLTA